MLPTATPLSKETVSELTVEEFLALCERRSWHFTYHWMQRKLKDLLNGTN